MGENGEPLDHSFPPSGDDDDVDDDESELGTDSEAGGKKKKRKLNKRMSRFIGKPKHKIADKEVLSLSPSSFFFVSFPLPPSSSSSPSLPLTLSSFFKKFYVDTASEMTDATDTTLCTSIVEDMKGDQTGGILIFLSFLFCLFVCLSFLFFSFLFFFFSLTFL